MAIHCGSNRFDSDTRMAERDPRRKRGARRLESALDEFPQPSRLRDSLPTHNGLDRAFRRLGYMSLQFLSVGHERSLARRAAARLSCKIDQNVQKDPNKNSSLAVFLGAATSYGRLSFDVPDHLPGPRPSVTTRSGPQQAAGDPPTLPYHM